MQVCSEKVVSLNNLNYELTQGWEVIEHYAHEVVSSVQKQIPDPNGWHKTITEPVVLKEIWFRIRLTKAAEVELAQQQLDKLARMEQQLREHSKCEDRIEELEKKISDLSDRSAAFHRSNQELCSERNDLRTQVVAQEALIKSLKEENEKLKYIVPKQEPGVRLLDLDPSDTVAQASDATEAPKE